MKSYEIVYDFWMPSRKSYTIWNKIVRNRIRLLGGYPQNRIRCKAKSYEIVDDFWMPSRKSYTIWNQIVRNRIRFSAAPKVIIHEIVRFHVDSVLSRLRPYHGGPCWPGWLAGIAGLAGWPGCPGESYDYMQIVRFRIRFWGAPTISLWNRMISYDLGTISYRNRAIS